MTHGNHNGAAYTAAIVDTITQPLLVVDEDLRIESANPAFFRKFGISAEQALGSAIYELGDGQWDIPELRRLLEEVLRSDDRVEGYRLEHTFETIGPRNLLLYANRMHRENASDLVLVAISDVTESERREWELEGQREFAEKLIDSIREALLVLDWDLRVRSANKSFYDCFEAIPEETEGRLIYELGNGQWDIPELRKLLGDILPKENFSDDYEVEHDFPSLGRRTMLLNARRLDHMQLILLAIRDVTEERKAEVQRDALVGELQHRVKNVLNNVRSLASHTRRSQRSLDGFFEAFEARLRALARTHDLIIRDPSNPVELIELVQLELRAVGGREGPDFTVAGPPVHIQQDAVQPVAMTLHELTTNAAKYGALKAKGGTVEIAWRRERRDGRDHLVLDWRERGVSVEDTEPAKGFGFRVIEESVPYMLDGAVEVTFHDDGVATRIEFPLPLDTDGDPG